MAAALFLAGCVDAQYPFQPEAKPLPAELSSRPEAQSIVIVEPVAGLPEPLGRALADAMASSLRKKSLPAVIDDGTGGAPLYSVSGRVTGQTTVPGPGRAIIWQVRDAHGRVVGRQLQQLPADDDLSAPPARGKLLADLAGQPTDMMVKGIEGDAAVPSDVADAAPSAVERPRHNVVVDKVNGAPGERGDLTLRQAIEYALKVVQVKVATERSADSLLLVGTVETSNLPSGTKHVKVTWSVRKPDGNELGHVSQENNVPGRVLELAWGEICSAVAQNAANSIASLVAQADTPIASKPEAAK